MNRLYVIVRRDLKPGMKIAQSCHAMAAFAEEHPSVTSLWHEGGNNLICLECDANELALMAEQSIQRGALVSLFREPDLGNELTAIAISGEAKSMLRRLPLAA